MNYDEVINRLIKHISPLRDMESTYNNEAIDLAIVAIRAQQERENPKPLTLDELKERDGKPVYCVDGADNKAWAVVNASAEDCIDNESGAWIFSYYALPGTDGLHGLNKQLGWLAYDYKPKGAVK